MKSPDPPGAMDPDLTPTVLTVWLKVPPEELEFLAARRGEKACQTWVVGVLLESPCNLDDRTVDDAEVEVNCLQGLRRYVLTPLFERCEQLIASR